MSGRRRRAARQQRRQYCDDDEPNSDEEEEMYPVNTRPETLYDDDQEEEESMIPYSGAASFSNPSYCQAVANALILPYTIPKFKTLRPYLEEALRKNYVNPIKSVYICACEAPSSRTSRMRNAIRWLVSWVSEVHHVEFVFRQECEDREEIVACTVDFDNPVHMAKLKPGGTDYNMHFWDVYAVKLTAAQRLGVYYFCCWQLDKPMNGSGIYLNFASGGLFAGSSPKDYNEESWFCSQLIAAALKWVGVEELRSLEPRTTTPGHLKALMTSSSSTLFDKTDDHSLVPNDQFDV